MPLEKRLTSELPPRCRVLVAGWAGPGYSARIAADYLVEEFRGELLAEIYSYHFPAHVAVSKEGFVEPVKCSLFKCKVEGDWLLVFSGDEEPLTPEGQFELAKEALEIATKLGVREVYIFDAVPGTREDSGEIKVACSDGALLEQLKEMGFKPLKAHRVIGVLGMLAGLASERGLRTTCLVTGTYTYFTPSGRMVADSRAAKALLEAFCKLTGLQLDLSRISREVKLTDSFIAELEAEKRRLLKAALKREGGPSYVR